MNPFVNIKVEGVDGLLKDFEKYGQEAKKAIKKAVDRTALAIETDAKKKLKADRHIITGNLYASIHREKKTGENHGDYSLDEPIGEMEAITGTNVVYAARIEFGFKGTDSAGRTYNQGPSSYLGYAALKQEKLNLERVEEELNKLNKG